ncbi:MAG: UDP-glucose/GDP-mannose dehydrogenase family protein [Candidatus Omnitrophica bacterium]|nr:UDP-glucose/GDP-mannose dehydrogenase family protein [Candidatus Omnitrophota bacterium]
MSSETRCSVVGLGKLGSCLAGVLASKGFEVTGVDVDDDVVAAFHRGESRLSEPQLARLLAEYRTHLRATGSHREAVQDSEVTMVVVPTPSEPTGGFSLSYVLDAMRKIGQGIAAKADYHLVVINSTVLPGSMTVVQQALEESSGKMCGKDFGVCYNPLFVSLGSVIPNILRADFILIGQSDEPAGRRLEAVYHRIMESSPPIARMNFVNAELTKLAVNTFVTTKISFANMLAEMCEQLPGADVDVVTRALGLDSRIGARYLQGGASYGGPCFPRDNKAIISLAQQLRCAPLIAESTDRFNHHHAQRLWGRVREVLTPGVAVAVLGLAYKPGTDVIEESFGMFLAAQLVSAGVPTMVFDPLPGAMEQCRRQLGGNVAYAASVTESLAEADVVIFTIPCKEFGMLTAQDFPVKAPPIAVFDCWRLLTKNLQGAPHVTFLPLGVGETVPALAPSLLSSSATAS